MNDATVRDPLPAGGPFRFDEMRAVYVGVGETVGDISWLECEVLAFRTSSVMRRNVKFLGWGFVANAGMVGAMEEGKGNGTWVPTA